MPKRTKPKTGWCYLCLTFGEITDEDVMPKWMRKTLRKLATDPTAPQPPKFLMPLCRPCNNGLGNRYEQKVAPIVRPLMMGSAITLDTDQQLLVASWAVLKDMEFAMAREYIYSFDGITRTSVRRRERWRTALRMLLRDDRPLPITSVRVGALMGLGVTDGRLFPEDLDPLDAFLTSVFPVGSGVFETVTAGDGDNAFLEGFIEQTANDERLIRIWPPQQPVVTIEPALLLGDVARLRNELGHHPDNLVGGFTKPPGV
jgi:hypothetical protein